MNKDKELNGTWIKDIKASHRSRDIMVNKYMKYIHIYVLKLSSNKDKESLSSKFPFLIYQTGKHVKSLNISYK